MSIFTDKTRFEVVEDCVNQLNEVATGEIVPQQSTISDEDYSRVKDLAGVSSLPNNIVKNRYLKVVAGDIDRTRKVDTQGKKYYDALDLNVDNAGSNRSTFMKSTLRNVASYDFTYIVMDDFAADTKSTDIDTTLKDRKFPYFTVIKPQAINEDYTKYDDNGNMIVLAYDYDASNNEDEDVTRTKIISAEKIEILEEGSLLGDPVLLDQAKYKGMKPFKVVKGSETGTDNTLLDSTPTTYGMCKTVLNIIALDASLDFSLEKNCFAQFVFTASEKRRNELREAKKKGEKFPLGDKGVIIEDSEQSNQSRFLVPETGNWQAISQRKQEKVEQIYREEGMKFSQGGSAQSADSKMMDQTENNTMLKFFSQIAKETDTWMDTIFALHLGLNYDPIESVYGYSDDFGLKDVEGQLDNLAQFLDSGANSIPTAKQITLKNMARQLFTGTDLGNTEKAIDDETFDESEDNEPTEDDNTVE